MFKLRPDTLKYISQSVNRKVKKPSKLNVGTKEFYNKHLDLVPRNVYLASGRILKMETVRKAMDRIAKESFSEKVSRWIDSIKCLFKNHES